MTNDNLKGETEKRMYLLLIFLMTLIIPLITIPAELRRGSASPYRTVIHAALYSSAAALVVFAAASLSGESVYRQLSAAVEDIAGLLAQDSTVIDMLGLEEASMDEKTDMFIGMYQQVFNALPASIMTFSAAAAYFEYLIISKVKKAHIPHTALMPAFREFSLPGGAVWGILLMYIASWIMTSTELLPNDLLYVNMDLIFDFVLSLQGISVILMLFHMKRIPKAIGVAAVVILWITVIGRWLLVLLGMLDIILGLKFRIQNNRPGR